MKLWIDDLRPAPEGYDWVKSVYQAKNKILTSEWALRNAEALCEGIYWNEGDYQKAVENHINYWTIDVIDIDHDAGEYADPLEYGGDYIKLLDWLEETGRNYPIHIHSMNPVGVQNMRAIIQHNNWKEA